ncbi:unnamed protein product [Didymodactylos carnosus]|uniref:Uncharacterized protein n=1 Tax=Didymodactylos carnosus TaxID=1234261 RepID=A0A815BR71_9BILA|nr:unnamed protein product [Didymodactylos carnosus]CAF1276376.1 unnamed protein product [Didymodactylos carnosus]CAF3896511.1 unnamed protein product [Didymodactylos carnosus]CAF4068231.1 unnamed protein product [Didymodactylos carnosus]
MPFETQDPCYDSNKNENKQTSWNKQQLYSYNDIPLYLQTNSFILNSYRHDLTIKNCLFSLFLLHNETFNIWTHLSCAIVFIYLFINDFKKFSTAKLDDFIVILFYTFSVIFCTLASTIFHMFNCCSSKAYHLCLKCDILGIAIAIFGGYIWNFQWMFKCFTYTRIFYQLIIALIILCVIVYYLKQPQFNSMLFISVPMAGILPIIHCVYLYGGWEQEFIQYFCVNMFVYYTVVGIGILFYRTKTPERFFPGRFDIFASSHQIWHIFSIISYFWLYISGIQLMEYHLKNPCINQ